MTSVRPKVSVLLTTYNRERYVSQAVDSVLAQTFTDFELIIVDDHSTDRTFEIVRTYAERDPRIRVSQNARTLGQFGNRNHAASLARAPYLKYHDSDDVMYRHCLSVMVSMLDEMPEAGFGISSGNAWPGGPCPMLLTPRMAYQREFFGAGMFMCGPAGAIFRTEVFRSLGGFDDHGTPSDYLFWLRACRQVSVALLPADLFWYRIHPDQAFSNPRVAGEYARTAADAWRALASDDCPLTPDERERARRNRAYHVAKRTVQDARRGRWDLVWTRVRFSGMGPLEWLWYLRPPRRDFLAGTPREANGDFIRPSWLS